MLLLPHHEQGHYEERNQAADGASTTEMWRNIMNTSKTYTIIVMGSQ